MRNASPYWFPGLSYARKQYPHVPDLVWLLAFLGIAAVGLIATFVLALLFIVGAMYASGNILPGVSVRGTGLAPVSVANMSAVDAVAKLGALSPDRTITLKDGVRTWTVSSADLGLAVDGPATTNKAIEVGRTNSTLLDGLRTMVTGATVEPVYTIDMARAENTLKVMSKAINTGALPNLSGRSLNVRATLDKIPPDVTPLLETGELTVVMDIVELSAASSSAAAQPTDSNGTQGQQTTAPAKPAYNGPRTRYTVEKGEELGIIAKKFNVDMNDIVALNNLPNADVIYPGQVLIIPAAGIWVPTQKDAPSAPLASGKSIVVDLGKQRIFAYQNGKLVYSALTSTGRLGHETPPGDYKIYRKYEKTRMRGPDYDLPDVPWTMYFHGGYGIHGAYWHNVFGRVTSHGCVNLDTSDAKWFYDFAPMGTVVRVIQG